MYEHGKHTGFDLDLQAPDQAGMMRRIAVHLPVNGLFEVEAESPPFEVRRPRIVQLTTPEEGEHPPQESEPTATWHDQQIEPAVVHSSPGRRIEPTGVLA